MSFEKINPYLMLFSLMLIATTSIFNMAFVKKFYSNPVLEISDIDHCYDTKGTGSMRPLIHNNTIVCIKDVKNEDELSVGDVIVFYGENDGVVNKIVHRIVDIDDGIYKTKGDYNAKRDIYNTTFDDIEGKVIFLIMK